MDAPHKVAKFTWLHLAAGSGGRALGPIFFFQPPQGGRVRVLDLEPVRRPAGAVRRPEPLGHDALAAKCAGMIVNDRAVPFEILVHDDAGLKPAEQFYQGPLAFPAPWRLGPRDHSGTTTLSTDAFIHHDRQEVLISSVFVVVSPAGLEPATP
jgi:hypothetical protein